MDLFSIILIQMVMLAIYVLVGILLGVVGIFAGVKLPTVIDSTLTKI